MGDTKRPQQKPEEVRCHQICRQVKHYNLYRQDSYFDKTVKMIEQQKKKLPPDKK